MTAPRLLIDLEKIRHNAQTLVTQLLARGISVTGVTKACLGNGAIAQEMVNSGVLALGESRVRNISSLRERFSQRPIWMQRAPMGEEAQSVVRFNCLSFISELETVAKLSAAAARLDTVHHVLLMVELGDLREGVMPGDLVRFVRELNRFEHIRLVGIGTNLACRSGTVPDTQNMSQLSTLTRQIEQCLGQRLGIVSGGNSANLGWALHTNDIGRINNLRLGEAILLGRETVAGKPLAGLHTTAFALVAEVIESKPKPIKPWGTVGQTPFQPMHEIGSDTKREQRTSRMQSILALGRQDIDPADLIAPAGVEVLGASSDHLIVDAGTERLPIGGELIFGLNYAGLLSAMTSPFVAREFVQTESVVVDPI